VSAADTPEPSSVTVIEPPKGIAWPDWRELWARRELIYVLGRRDIAVLYKQSSIGALWAVAQPLALAGVFSLFFGHLARITTGTSVPYPVFAILGMVTWLFFAGALSNVSNSTVSNAPLISKVYFPRLVIPISAVAQPTVDFAVGLVVALGVTLAYGVIPPVQVVLLPLIAPLVIAVALGVGIWLAAIHVKYRDVGNVVSFCVLLGLFVTPIVYPFSNIPEAYQTLYGLNPMVGVLELMRWMTLPGWDFQVGLIIITIAESALLIVTGVMYYGRAERSFADVI
jgi:homopolymeric O-antigen transport system permease protein